MSGSSLFLLILCAGVFSQWFSWKMRLPAIVVLIAAGVVLGPVTGLVTLHADNETFNDIVGLGIAIILFTGGMELKVEEYRQMAQGIKRLTIIGPPLAWIFGSAAAHYIAGISWPVSFVLGAILVVTGPTVVLPLLRQAKLNKESTMLLRWEGIVNDPVGVLFAVLTFHYLTLSTNEVESTLLGLGGAFLAAVVLGGGGGWLLGLLYRRGLVPEYLKVPMLLTCVLLTYWVSNHVQEETGLLSVTLMGVVLGNTNLSERNLLLRFKDDLSTILLSVLFIVIASRLNLRDMLSINWRSVLFVASLMVIVRPLTIWLASIHSNIRYEDRWLLSWIAPRGIVAAATAGLFGPVLMQHGYTDADKLLPIIFLVILATVIAHGFSLGWFAGKLGLTVLGNNPAGLMIVGSSPWTVALAGGLKKLGIPVLIIDGSFSKLQMARMAGVDVYYGELLSEHAEQALEIQQYVYILCASDNDYYNALVCNALGMQFGHHLTLQLPTHQEAKPEEKKLPLQQRGYFAFNERADYEFLLRKLEEGWIIQTTPLTQVLPFSKLQDTIRESCRDWILIGGVSQDGRLRLFSEEQPFAPDTGWTLIYFAQPPSNDKDAS